MADTYECSLDEDDIELAKTELNEIPEERLEAVRELRQKLEEERASLRSITDTKFLLAMLRTAKFNQKAAKERTRGYWKARTNGLLKMMSGMDPADPSVLNILRGPAAVYLPLPGYDRLGRKVILARWEQLDCSGTSYTFKEWLKAMMLIFDAMCFEDEKVQVRGVVFLMDAAGVALKHLKFFGFDNSRKQFSLMQKAYPIRIKQVHYINNTSVIEAFFTAVKVVLSDKLSKRICLHGRNMVPVYKDLGMDILPEEYLPDNYDGPCQGSAKQIMNQFIEEKILAPERLALLRQLYSTEYGLKSEKKTLESTLEKLTLEVKK